MIEKAKTTTKSVLILFEANLISLLNSLKPALFDLLDVKPNLILLGIYHLSYHLC